MCGSSPGDHPIGRIDIGPIEVVLPSKHIALWSKGKVVITASTSGNLSVEGYDCECLKTEIFVMNRPKVRIFVFPSYFSHMIVFTGIEYHP